MFGSQDSSLTTPLLLHTNDNLAATAIQPEEDRFLLLLSLLVENHFLVEDGDFLATLFSLRLVSKGVRDSIETDIIRLAHELASNSLPNRARLDGSALNTVQFLVNSLTAYNFNSIDACLSMSDREKMEVENKFKLIYGILNRCSQNNSSRFLKGILRNSLCLQETFLKERLQNPLRISLYSEELKEELQGLLKPCQLRHTALRILKINKKLAGRLMAATCLVIFLLTIFGAIFPHLFTTDVVKSCFNIGSYLLCIPLTFMLASSYILGYWPDCLSLPLPQVQRFLMTHLHSHTLVDSSTGFIARFALEDLKCAEYHGIEKLCKFLLADVKKLYS